MIRHAEIEDTPFLSNLMNTLGYPTSNKAMHKRMKTILAHQDYQTFVYQHQNRVVGMIGMSYSSAYHSDKAHVRVIAFVVEESIQGKGIGQKLMAAAERWATAQGAVTLILNSGNRAERNKAHQIYESLGFEGKATGFYKKLI